MASTTGQSGIVPGVSAPRVSPPNPVQPPPGSGATQGQSPGIVSLIERHQRATAAWLHYDRLVNETVPVVVSATTVLFLIAFGYLAGSWVYRAVVLSFGFLILLSFLPVVAHMKFLADTAAMECERLEELGSNQVGFSLRYDDAARYWEKRRGKNWKADLRFPAWYLEFSSFKWQFRGIQALTFAIAALAVASIALHFAFGL